MLCDFWNKMMAYSLDYNDRSRITGLSPSRFFSLTTVVFFCTCIHVFRVISTEVRKKNVKRSYILIEVLVFGQKKPLVWTFFHRIVVWPYD